MLNRQWINFEVFRTQSREFCHILILVLSGMLVLKFRLILSVGVLNDVLVVLVLNDVFDTLLLYMVLLVLNYLNIMHPNCLYNLTCYHYH